MPNKKNTEEEKKQAQLLQQQASKEVTLDEWYNTNKDYLDKEKQLQMEDAYVNQELMNKYLNESLAQQGLDQSGVANLFRQQLNTDYMNTRANIANANQQSQLDLYNKYYSAKKEEQDKVQGQMYDMYTNKIANSVNQYGFIDDDTQAALNQYIDENPDKFGSNYKDLLQSQLDLYRGNEEQIKAYKEDNYQSYLDDLYSRIGDSTAITDEDYDTLVSELDTVKGKIGEANYHNAMQTLTAYKTMGDVVEKLNENNRISSYDYTKLKEAIDTLKEEGTITTAAYNEILKNLEILKLSIEEENAAYQKQLQEGLFNANLDPVLKNLVDLNEQEYISKSNDALLEKYARVGAARVVKAFKSIGETISDFWKKNIWD